MPSTRLPAIEDLSPVQALQEIQIQVSLALENPRTLEECENLAASLGPQYEEDPEAISGLLRKVDPALFLDRLRKENPDFDLNQPLRETVQNVVATLLSMRPA